ncbi:MAG: S8 family serine peptidase [Pirellulaceae bacterium]
MKPHLVIKFARPLPGIPCDHWQNFVHDKSRSVTSVRTDIDQVFQRFAIPFWVTFEYPPADQVRFSQDEIKSGFDRTYRFILRSKMGIPPALVEQIRIIPDVQSVREIAATISELPDRLSQTRSYLGRSSWATKMIGLKQAHLHTDGVPQVKVAILDTGVEANHPELAGQISQTADFVDFAGLETTSFIGDLIDADEDAADEVGHGTHVAGILTGKGIKIARGVCPGCTHIVVRVLATLQQGNQRVGAGLIDNINVGIKWAVDQGADVINMSLGIRHEHGGLPHQDVIEYALRRGATVVAASGNDGSDNKYYPGALPGVIAVGAADPSGNVADFTSFGARISFLAPGVQILSAYRSGDYIASSGTSQAAPFVSGAIALLKSLARKAGKNLNDNAVKYILKNSADRQTPRWHDGRSGYGIINLADAFTLTRHSLN